MLLPELQSLAGSMHITGTARMRKGELIAAIQLAQGAGGSTTGAASAASSSATKATRAARTSPASAEGGAAGAAAASNGLSSGADATAATRESNGHSGTATAPTAVAPTREAEGEPSPNGSGQESQGGEGSRRRRRGSSRPTGSPAGTDVDSAASGELPQISSNGVSAPDDTAATNGSTGSTYAPSEARTDTRPERQDRQDRQDRQGPRQREQGQRDQQGQRQGNQDRQGGQQGQDRQDRQDRSDRQQGQSSQGNQGTQERQGGQPGQQGQDRQSNSQNDFGDEFNGSRRRGRFRERRPRNGRQGGGQGGPGYNDAEPIIREDDVLVPIAGILDILDSYAFVRTTGYLTGPNDVYVSLAQVRRHGLRRGDAVTGAVRQPQEGEKKDKYNAMVRLDTINGLDPEEARKRPEFTKLTPLYPNERLRLETEPNILTTRVIDLVMPLGKGQRALIVSPPKAGKTMVLQAIANAITTNNPECHLMVVLVDERPEEVTDMQRSVKGEVIASTFDRPPTDHTSVAELAIERAKRLVEMGHDVVVLLDSITRLGRAYNLAAPTSGRILSGGVDSTALYPPKRFLGAARNIEHGGSLTILATALVETGSTMDTVIFEEFKGTGNAELKLDRRIADKRVFPAVDVDASGTRKEELLLNPEELNVIYKLRRVLHALDSQQGIELLLDRLKQSRTNYEFLMQIAKTTPGE
jgi:transcription termination factor Rho